MALTSYYVMCLLVQCSYLTILCSLLGISDVIVIVISDPSFIILCVLKDEHCYYKALLEVHCFYSLLFSLFEYIFFRSLYLYKNK